jgi:triacylglycerol lipase
MKMQLPTSTLANVRPPDKKNYEYFQLLKEKPFAQSADFNLINAWRLCELSLIAYADKAFVEEKSKGLKAEGYSIDSEGGTETEYLFVSSPTDVIVVFRGTEIDNFLGSVSDWLTDFRIGLRPDSHGNGIHEGFTVALDRVWKGLKSRIETVTTRNKNIRVWFTGHSLGAALAALSAYRASIDNLFDVHAVYTYGSPRVGDKGFLDHFIKSGLNARTFRFRNNSDIVTRVPPFSHFFHVGQSHLIDNTGNLHLNTEPASESSVAAVATVFSEVARLLPCLLPGADQTLPMPGAIADHGPTFYTMHLFNNI